MNRPLLNQEDFLAFWDRLQATYPAFRQSAEDEKHAQRVWYDVVKVFSINTLHAALIDVAKRTDRRPTPAAIVEAAQLIVRAKDSGQKRAHVDGTCECGCGGTRWLEIMLDANGNERIYPHDVEPPAGLPTLRTHIRAMAGKRMLRPKLHCRRIGMDTPNGQLVDRENGVPVYLPAGFYRYIEGDDAA